MLNFDKTESYETPNPSVKSISRQQFNFIDKRKTLANELNVEVFEEFLSQDD